MRAASSAAMEDCLPLGPGPPSLACHFFLFLLLLLAITAVFFNPKRQRRSSNLPSPLQSVKADAADTGRWGGLTARSSQAVSEEGQQVECFSDRGRSALICPTSPLALILPCSPPELPGCDGSLYTCTREPHCWAEERWGLVCGLCPCHKHTPQETQEDWSFLH